MKFLRGKILAGLRTAGRAGLDVAFPRWCVACGELVETGPLEHVCGKCLEDVVLAPPPHCATCGWPFHGAVEGARRCPHCIELEPRFGEGRTGMLVRGAARVVIHELKYRQGLHLRGDLRGLARRAPWLLEFVRGAVLVPVPLHVKRLRERGFNQALLVAEALAVEAEVIQDGKWKMENEKEESARVGMATRVAELLARVRDTATQTRLDREARERNVKGAFAIAPGAVVSGTVRYVLVDDVFTTGATLNACTLALRQAGARKVDVATLGHG
ncbi:MAG: ComF family protein [Opitutales bacterium]|jgi:predicted amidophosphoribosyltransferase